MSDADISDSSKTTLPGGPPPGLTSRFKATGKLGSGGMGDVYLAEDLQLKRQVALKTIRPDLCRNTEIRKRIERECLLHAKIGSHPHIVTLYDRIESDGQINLVMEYVEGETLQQLLENNARHGLAMAWKDCLDIAAQVLDALARIHAHGIVHRDIKPSNILLARDDAGGYCAKLMDFGIARMQADDDASTILTKAGGSGPGTPTYMAPEQIDPVTFGPVSHATDVYAMGIMLYQIVSGKPPFTGGVTEVFYAHLNRKPPPLDFHGDTSIPPAIAEILDCALSKEPSQRFPSAKSFREELMRLALPESAGVRMASVKIPVQSSQDAGKTIAASDIEAAAAHREATQLGTATGHRNTGRRLLAAVAVILLLLAAAFGGYMAYAKLRGGSVSDAPPAQSGKPETENAAKPEAVANTPPVVPAAPAPAVTAPPAVTPAAPAPAVSAPPVTPAAPAPAVSAPPVALAAPASVTPAVQPPVPAAEVPLPPGPPSDQPANTAGDSGQGGSALKALEAGRAQSQTNEPSPKPEPAPKPKPEPAVKPAPKPAPEPEVKPAPKPEPPPQPKPKPTPKAEPAAPDWSNSVIRKEERKVK